MAADADHHEGTYVHSETVKPRLKRAVHGPKVGVKQRRSKEGQ
jgi:hypothetical protein